jgi:hypothetical protein
MPAHPLQQGMTAALTSAFNSTVSPNLPIGIVHSITSLVTNGAENCILVALTNVAGTVADRGVMPQLLAKQAGGVDFRSLYKKTTRPFLVATASSLSVHWKPSSDPYVSNPFREPRIDNEWVTRRLNKLAGAGDLRTILEHVADNPEHANDVLVQLAHELLARLGKSQVAYNLPPRLTTAFVSALLEQWLNGGSNGARLEHTAIALLRFAGSRLNGTWDEVESHHVNDPKPYDALCVRKGQVVAIAECKDQLVTAEHILQLSVEMAHRGASRGFIFTRAKWIDDRVNIDAAIKSRSVHGFRIDTVEIGEAIRTWLSLIDIDDGSLRSFMNTLIEEMNENGRMEDRRELAILIDKRVLDD